MELARMSGDLRLLVVAGVAAVVSLAPARGQDVQPTTPAPGAAGGYLALEEGSRAPQTLTVQVLSEYPHDPQAYTQGLLLDGTVLIESTGHYGRSDLREVDLVSGHVMRSRDLPSSHFGEGVALVDDRLIQLTWKEGVAHVWDRASLDRIGEFRYEGEGWGLVYDGSRLIMSDGSDRLQFRDPDSFELLGEVRVRVGDEPLDKINELTFAQGMVWANVWLQDFIVGIDPDSGRVRAVVDARGLRGRLTRAPGAPSPEVLNGITYREDEGTFFVTGKYWPTMFEVQFVGAP